MTFGERFESHNYLGSSVYDVMEAGQTLKACLSLQVTSAAISEATWVGIPVGPRYFW